MSPFERIGVLTLAIILSTSGACSASQTDSSPPDYREHYVQIEKEARRTLDALYQERDYGQRALTPQFVEDLHVWSKRLADAQLRLSPSREERIRAVGAYFTEMKRLDQIVQGATDLNVQKRMTRYYVAEGELWLERVKRE